MRTDLSFEARDYPLKDVLFASQRFEIPRYQRPYSWGNDQLVEFWNDLVSDDAPVFLGSFILNNEQASQGIAEVIDGQQRILTVTIFMAVVRDLARQLKSDLAELIQRHDIASEDRDGIVKCRVRCGDSTREYFEKAIQEEKVAISDCEAATKEERLVREAYAFFEEMVLQELGRFSEDSQKIRRLRRFRDQVSNLIVIRIDIHSEEDAYEIFETTNARGVDLSVSDLLKNLIFKNVQIDEDRGDFAKEVWAEILANVENTDTEMKRFIRYFWISKNPLVHDKQLYKAIKRKTTDWDELLHSIWTASNDYNRLLEGTREAWSDFKRDSAIFRSVRALRLMRVMQCHVLLMSILRNKERLDTDPSRIFGLIESFSFSYSAIGRMPGNRVEKLYAQYANQIEEAANEPPKKRPGAVQRVFASLERDLKDLRPPYPVFLDRFREVSYSRSAKSRQLVSYILGKIEEHQGTGEKEIDFDVVNIEHILPQSPGKDWSLTKKDIKPYVNRLGNLTLVHKEFNSRAGNKTPEAKLDELGKTEMRITRQLVGSIRDNSGQWGEAEILARQDELAEIAYNQVWSF